MAKNSSARYLVNGIIKENPVLALVIGLCPTLAVSTSAYNALGMGIAVLFVLTLSNFTISLIRKLIAGRKSIPCRLFPSLFALSIIRIA